MAQTDWSVFGFAIDPARIKDDPTSFLACVGKAIALWTHVETALGEVYTYAVGAHGIAVTPFHQPITVSFYEINSFETRLAVTSGAVGEWVRGHAEIKKEWVTLADRATRNHRVRSHIAHFSLYGHPDQDPGKQIWLQPNPPIGGVRRAAQGKPPIRYFRDDLERFCEQFKTTANDLHRFCSSPLHKVMHSGSS
jgi:hypothetical protein